MFGSSPKLIAAYHVFHRLLAPRHPPVALIILILVYLSIFPSIPYVIVNEPQGYTLLSGFLCLIHTRKAYFTFVVRHIKPLCKEPWRNTFGVLPKTGCLQVKSELGNNP